MEISPPQEESNMSDRELLTFGALGGAVYGVLETAGFMVGGASNPHPIDGLPSGATAAAMASAPMPAGVWVGFGLEVFSTLFLVAFAVAGWAVVRAADEHGVLAMAALIGAITNVALIMVSFGIAFAINASAGHGLEAQGLIVLSDLQTGTFVLSWTVLGLFLGCLSVAALRTRSLPSWLGWIGVALGVAELAAFLFPLGAGQLVQLVPLVWIPAAGIALAIRRPAAASQPKSAVVGA
jgi:hypothetical protein